MVTVSRSEFKSIVVHAISLAPKLTAKQRKALLRLADRTSAVGPNFNTAPACPAGQAFGYPSGAVGMAGPLGANSGGYGKGVADFAFAYDDVLRERGICRGLLLLDD